MLSFYKTTLGKKVVMALTGLVMIGFLVGHMAGNLKIFAGINKVTGDYKLDEYAHFLREVGSMLVGHEGVLWGTRVVLVAAVILHIIAAIQLTAQHRAGRPESYRNQRYRSATFASRFMALGGIVIALFVVFHILHFTTGHLHFEGFKHGEVYANVYRSFSIWYYVVGYLVALTAVAFHLYHGGWSLFQTLGVDSPRTNMVLREGAKALAVILWIGFVSVPLAVYFGFLDPPAENTRLVAMYGEE